MARPKAVIVGAGALGLWYLAEQMARDYDLCLADLSARAPLLRRIQAEQGYTVNVCGTAAMEQRRVSGSFSIAYTDVPAGATSLAEALAVADLVLTAVGKRALPAVVPAVAPVLNAHTRPIWLLFCENGLDIAATHRPAFAAHVAAADTVMSRMCRFGDPGEAGYAPLWPGLEQQLVVESFAYLPLDRTICQGGPFTPGFDLVTTADFAMWEDIKLFMHNGMHAFVSYHAFLEGAQHFPQVPEAIRTEARRVMLAEVVPAILHHHPQARPAEVERYGLDLLARFYNPYLNDSIERGVRGAEEKLAPGERLLGGCEFIRQAGIEPRGYATTIDAAREIVRRKG
jgi:mannitol-1-phosphate/altronate dehydrogenase